MTNDLLGGYVVVYPPKKKFPLVKNQNFPPNSFLKKFISLKGTLTSFFFCFAKKETFHRGRRSLCTPL